MASSLRWRLQAWHALILLLVVAGFGATLYVQVRRARFDEIDAELLAGARVLEGTLRIFPAPVLRGEVGPGAFADFPIPEPGQGPPPGFRDGRPPDLLAWWNDRRRPPPPPPRRRDGRPPRPEDEEAGPDGPGPGAATLAGRPPAVVPPPGSPAERHLQALRLPVGFEDRYADEDRPPYFVIVLGNDRVLSASPEGTDVAPDPRAIPGRDVVYRNRDRRREVTLLGPERSRILVGRTVEGDLGRLHGLAWRIGLTGLGVLAAGLIGGGWLSARAVRPIEVMSDTVAGITARRLSDRIDLERVDDELGRLGGLLNGMLDRLELAFAQQVQFTADASHELRTPLSVILTQAELALARSRTPEEYREALAVCQRAGRRMSALVDDLLWLARADSGRPELADDPVDLGALAAETVALLGTLADKRQVLLEAPEPDAPVVVRGDPHRLAQVLTNLVTNAILYTNPGGRVTMTVAPAADGDTAVVTIADTGVGIAPEDLPRIFDRFYRAERSRSRGPGAGPWGSGLGLAICKGVVEAHRGEIEVRSAPGAGTTFVVRLPRRGPAAKPDPLDDLDGPQPRRAAPGVG